MSRSYTLDVAVQPPSVAHLRVPLYPPLVVRVHIHDSATGYEISGEDELSGLFAQATLYRESGLPPSLAPPDMFLLSGRLSRGLDHLFDPCDGSPLREQQGSYALFPDLTINRPGRYRLGVSLFRVDGRGGGTALVETKTEVVFVVEDGGGRSGVDGVVVGEWLFCLAFVNPRGFWGLMTGGGAWK